MKSRLVLLILTSLIYSSCASQQVSSSPLAEELLNIVFIHGSHFDNEAWEKILPEMKPHYRTQAINLIAREAHEVATIQQMAQTVCLQVNSPSAFVGHSFGGAVINEMVGICPEKISSIIYVTALVPLKGEGPFDAASKADEIGYKKSVRFTDRIYPRSKLVFFKHMDPDLKANQLPKSPLHSESLAIGAMKIDYDLEVFAKTPKAYIFAERDPIITIATQRKFTERSQITRTKTLNSAHLPMLSQPEELAAAIKSLLGEINP